MIPLADDYHPHSWTLITFLLQKNVCFIYWCWSTRPVFLQLPLPGSLFLYLSMLLRPSYFSQVFFKLFLPWCPRSSSVACYALSHTGPATPFIILTVLAINCSTWFPTNITNTNSPWSRSHVFVHSYIPRNQVSYLTYRRCMDFFSLTLFERTRVILHCKEVYGKVPCTLHSASHNVSTSHNYSRTSKSENWNKSELILTFPVIHALTFVYMCICVVLCNTVI